MLPLIFYDIPSKLPGKMWSVNTAKPRFVLGYKNLPFETVWVEYADIALKMKEIGASPNTMPDGRSVYTLPVLSDPNTGALITDSWAIAIYLDETYPEKPIFPHGSRGLIAAVDSAVGALGRPSVRFSLLRSAEVLEKRNRDFFVTAREKNFGASVDWSPEGPTRDTQWASTENDFYNSIKTWYDRVDGKWIMGDTLCYADILLAARCFWYKRVYHDDEWKKIASFHDGKWARFLADAEKECNVTIAD